MRDFLNLGAGILVAMSVLTACAEQVPDVLTVSARVEIDVMPDAAVVDIQLQERASSREDVLKKIVEKQNSLREGLKNQEGIKSIKFEANEVRILPVSTQECARSLLGKMGEYADLDDAYEAYELCPNTDFRASISLSATIMPPAAAGAALSYATLSEVSLAELDEFIIVDMQKAKQNAKSAAAGKIRSIAQDIASQSGVKLGRIKSLSFKGDSHFAVDKYGDQEIVVTARKRVTMTEAVRLDVDPEFITIAETVTATFVISE